MPYLPLDSILSSGLTDLASIWTSISASTFLGPIIGIAVGGIGISVLLGIFFRR